LVLIPKINCNDIHIKQKALKELENVCKQCNSCLLSKSRTTTVFGDGNPDAKILLISEAPGVEEDQTGKLFVGKSGQLLKQFLETASINKEKDIYFCNTVKCKPPQNRIPTNEEKSACKLHLLGQIAIIKPKIILLCGTSATESFIKENVKVSEIRGKWLNVFDGIDTMVIYHPAYLLRNHSNEENSPRWLMQKDLLNIKRKIKEMEK